MNTLTILAVAILIGVIGFYEIRFRKLREEINARKLDVDLRFLAVLHYMEADLVETFPNLDEYGFDEVTRADEIPDHLQNAYAMWGPTYKLNKGLSK